MTAFSCFALEGLPEIVSGTDLGALIGEALEGRLEAGDVVVVSSKVVSKAEGRAVAAEDREQAITDETVRVVATRARPDGGPGGVRIVENRLGIVGAAAGVDASNTAPGTVLLLPLDPDASAARLRVSLTIRFALPLAVVVTDTLGRPWRLGQTDVAIGAAGLLPVDDLRGRPDASGRTMDVSVTAVADEIAAAADLVKGKARNRPVAVVRGLGHLLIDDDGPGARSLVRSSADDLFRTGHAEAYSEGYRDGHAAGSSVPNGTVPDEHVIGSGSRTGGAR